MKRTCPCCSSDAEADTALTDKYDPRPGDFSLCFNCGAVLVYSDDCTSLIKSDMETLKNSVSETSYKQTIQVRRLILARYAKRN